MKKVLFAIAAVVISCSLTGCKEKTTYKDITTFIMNEGYGEGHLAGEQFFTEYASAVAQDQGGTLTDDGVILAHQENDLKAKQGATSGAEKAKAAILKKKIYQLPFTLREGTYDVEVTESTEAEANAKIAIYIENDQTRYLTHYYKVTRIE